MDESGLTEVFCYQVSMAAVCVLRNEGTICFSNQKVSVTSVQELEKSLPTTGHRSSTCHTTAQGPTDSTNITTCTLVEALGATDGTQTSLLSEAQQSTYLDSDSCFR